jgi:hypothetical protein
MLIVQLLNDVLEELGGVVLAVSILAQTVTDILRHYPVRQNTAY